MEPQMQETADTRDKPGEAIDYVAKPAASLNGNMVTRRSPLGAVPAPAPALAPVRPDDATPVDREEWPAGPVRTAVAGLRAMGSGLVPKPAAGSRHGLRLPKWGIAVAIFVFAYLGFVVAILAGLNFMPEFLPTL